MFFPGDQKPAPEVAIKETRMFEREIELARLARVSITQDELKIFRSFFVRDL